MENNYNINFNNPLYDGDYIESENIQIEKYDSRDLSPHNINFVLKGNQNPNKKSILSLKSPNVNTISKNSNKIISFNYSELNPYSRISQNYSVQNSPKYNLVCTSEPMKNKKILFDHSKGNINNQIFIPFTRQYNYSPYNINYNRSYLKNNINNIDNNDNCKYNDYCFSCEKYYENKRFKKMLQEMFNGEEMESYVKVINLKTYNSPNQQNRNSSMPNKNNEIYTFFENNKLINVNINQNFNRNNISTNLYENKYTNANTNLKILKNQNIISNLNKKGIQKDEKEKISQISKNENLLNKNNNINNKDNIYVNSNINSINNIKINKNK